MEMHGDKELCSGLSASVYTKQSRNYAQSSPGLLYSPWRPLFSELV